MHTFIQQGCIKLILSESKDIYNLTKIYISNSLQQKKEIKQHNCLK